MCAENNNAGHKPQNPDPQDDHGKDNDVDHGKHKGDDIGKHIGQDKNVRHSHSRL